MGPASLPDRFSIVKAELLPASSLPKHHHDSDNLRNVDAHGATSRGTDGSAGNSLRQPVALAVVHHPAEPHGGVMFEDQQPVVAQGVGQQGPF